MTYSVQEERGQFRKIKSVTTGTPVAELKNTSTSTARVTGIIIIGIYSDGNYSPSVPVTGPNKCVIWLEYRRPIARPSSEI